MKLSFITVEYNETLKYTAEVQRKETNSERHTTLLKHTGATTEAIPRAGILSMKREISRTF